MKIEKNKLENILIVITIIIIVGIIFFYQTQKVGFHEDEAYTITTSVNEDNGLMTAYKDNELPENEKPEWKTKELVKNNVTLAPKNYLNIWAIYQNQMYDNHPPFFYTLVHFSIILFAGQFTKYSVFLVNIIAFILSCYVLKKTLKLLNKENLTIGALLFYGLSMGTISMVLFQRMYMLLNLFIMIYFYYSIVIYKNDFKIDKKQAIKLGITTVLGFLTQYFFAIYAGLIFIMMIIKMIKDKKQENIKRYVNLHVLYAITGVLIFLPCIKHLLFSDRGLTNLGNSDYIEHFGKYIQHLAYAFSINNNIIVIISVFALFFVGTIYLYRKSNEKFIILLTTLPSIIYFIIAVKLTSFQELRYIMTVIPFVVLILFLVLDTIIKVKYKDIIIIAISVILVTIGIVSSEPKFLYRDYEKIIQIAQENSDKSFVYVYDNFFNHMQSIPEMLVYEKTLIINNNKNELEYVLTDENLNNEDSYILSIKSYMNNEEILDKIKNNTEFKNIETIYTPDYSKMQDSMILNNIYLVSK